MKVTENDNIASLLQPQPIPLYHSIHRALYSCGAGLLGIEVVEHQAQLVAQGHGWAIVCKLFEWSVHIGYNVGAGREKCLFAVAQRRGRWHQVQIGINAAAAAHKSAHLSAVYAQAGQAFHLYAPLQQAMPGLGHFVQRVVGRQYLRTQLYLLPALIKATGRKKHSDNKTWQ